LAGCGTLRRAMATRAKKAAAERSATTRASKTRTTKSRVTPSRDRAEPASVESVLAWLERRGSKRNRDGMARYGIVAEKAYGVSVGDLRDLGKRLGRSHELALALWETGVYEARMLTPFVDEPERVTPAQMDRWCRDFDNWGICDTVCFHLFDRTPHAWKKVVPWSRRRAEFEKRAAFALLACLALHDKQADDDRFLRTFPLIEKAASDDRNFVKKGVSWALRLIGHRNRALHAAAVELSRKLAASGDRTAQWVGKDALRDLTRPAVIKKVASRTT
jgi:3-methyladenine DNA glycosylase AlkD